MTDEEKLPVYLTKRSLDIILVILNLISTVERAKNKLLGKLDVNQYDLDEIKQSIVRAKEAADKHLRELYR